MDKEKKELEENEINKLSLLFGKLEGLNSLKGINNIIPSYIHKDENTSVVFEALRSKSLVDNKVMQYMGFEFFPLQNEWVRIREPIMNERGISKIIHFIRTTAEEIEFSHIEKEDINRYALNLLKNELVEMFLNYKKYDLSPSDFGLIFSDLVKFTISSLNKAKHGGHRGAFTRTISEDTIQKVLNEDKAKKGGLLEGLKKIE